MSIPIGTSIPSLHADNAEKRKKVRLCLFFVFRFLDFISHRPRHLRSLSQRRLRGKVGKAGIPRSRCLDRNRSGCRRPPAWGPSMIRLQTFLKLWRLCRKCTFSPWAVEQPPRLGRPWSSEGDFGQVGLDDDFDGVGHDNFDGDCDRGSFDGVGHGDSSLKVGQK